MFDRVYRVTGGAVTPTDLVYPNGLPDLDTGELPLDAPAPLFDAPCDDEARAGDAPLLQDAA